MVRIWKNKIIADVIINGQIEKDIEFDFSSDSTRTLIFSGYSKQLNSKVIVNTFDRRGLDVETKVPEEIKTDIYLSYKNKKEETEARLLTNKVTYLNQALYLCSIF